jgi:hypothetical protein
MPETTKQMVCYDCGMKITATLAQAKRHGWELWVGGARCKVCRNRHDAGEAMPTMEGNVVLTREEFESVMDLLRHPPKPTETLKRLMRRQVVRPLGV